MAAEGAHGPAARLASAFLFWKLTPVVAVASIVMGVLAVWLTPKEEEPQISVPMIDILTPAPGLAAADVEREVTEPIERAVWGLEGVEYVYASSSAHASLVTVRFRVGEPLEPSLVKVHDRILALRPELPERTRPSEVRSYTIDDVPFLVLTFSSHERDDHALRTLVAPLARELSRTPELSRVEVLGGLRRAVRVVADPPRMAARGISLPELAEALRTNDARLPAGKTWGEETVKTVEIGSRLESAEDVRTVAIGQRGGAIVRVGDVATVTDGPEERTRSSVLLEEGEKPQPAVSLAFAKRRGSDVTRLSKSLLQRAELFRTALPSDVKLSVVRDYGATAGEKAKELIEHLLLATFSVAVLIALAMGLRASLVVGVAIPVTLALTLVVYWLFGYTLNRVTLFALIFSIGILVDDAIVVVENIERHLRSRPRGALVPTVMRAVSEVGNPTILATFTVIAAILPMAFVRGLMGPYMRPIPLGGSLAMLLSLVVAFTLTPWAAVRLLKVKGEHAHKDSFLDRLYRALMHRLLGRAFWSWLFGAAVVLLLAGAIALLFTRSVHVKLLPFDDREEFQVLLDLPATTPLEQTLATSQQLAAQLLEHPEVEAVQIHAGEAAPFTFSGMVKHTYLRGGDWMADLTVQLTPRHHRDIDSHTIVNELREGIAAFGSSHETVTKVLEVPPGPPVMATMLAEVYGPTEASRLAAAEEVRRVFAEEESVVDLDVSWRPERPRLVYRYDLEKGGLLGTNAQLAAESGRLLFSDTPLLHLQAPDAPEPVPVTLSVVQELRSGTAPLSGQTLPSREAGIVSLGSVLEEPQLLESVTLHRKNLTPVSYVMSELAGEEEAPVYGILSIGPKLDLPQQTARVPWNLEKPVVKWDGEWFVTYEVFRDLGAAFAAVLLLIYFLVVAWFRSYSVPLIIMAPIPISLIGILPGHAIAGAFFTATSMIGFIAGAGVIVRNSIILVDYIEQQLAQPGMNVRDAVIEAGVLRFRPMLLTAAAVVVGSSVMLTDPIFQGLALSLISGEIAATLLSRIAVPVLYYRFVGRQRASRLAARPEASASVPTRS